MGSHFVSLQLQINWQRSGSHKGWGPLRLIKHGFEMLSSFSLELIQRTKRMQKPQLRLQL